MLPMMRGLVDLERQFGQSTVEETVMRRIARDMQSEIEGLRWRIDVQQAAHRESQRTCCICIDDSTQGLECVGHLFVCSDCCPLGSGKGT